MKKIFSVLLAIVMVLSLSVSAFAFNDVDVDNTNYEAIETLYALEVIEGYGGGVYGPNDELTRAQLATMLGRAIYGDDNAHYLATGVFTDVPVNHWARLWIDTCYENELMVGYGGNKFGPDDKLTYTQTARTILNALGHGTYSWPTGVDTIAYELGLYAGLGTIKDTSAVITRAHAAQMIFNAFDLDTMKVVTGITLPNGGNFLNDVLGYKDAVNQWAKDGYEYITYTTTGKNPETVWTNIVTSYDTVISSVNNGQQYKIGNDTETIAWGNVALYVNGEVVTVDKNSVWASVKTGIGRFSGTKDANGDPVLYAIYMTIEGVDYYYNVNNSTDDYLGKVTNGNTYIENFADINVSDDSVITYYPYINKAFVSNTVKYGYVSNSGDNFVTVNGAQYIYDNDANNKYEFVKGDYVKIYFNHLNEMFDIVGLDNTYAFNTETMKYHHVDCYYYADYSNSGNWVMDDEVIQYVASKGEDMTFAACGHCGPGSTIKYDFNSIEVEYDSGVVVKYGVKVNNTTTNWTSITLDSDVVVYKDGIKDASVSESVLTWFDTNGYNKTLATWTLVYVNDEPVRLNIDLK